MENETIYAYKLQHIDNPTFDDVQRLARNFINDLPQSKVDEIYNDLNRGVDQLTTEPQMLVYLHSFGSMHQFKLNRAFEQLPDAFLQQPEIRIVDYGCGQAIGTMCYADFLAARRLSQTIKTVTLIEPSDICLKRAALHVSQFFPNAEIRTICKTFDNLDADDLAYTTDIPTLHILSNVLDIQEFDLEDFANLIANNLTNYNQFVCVGPYFSYSNKDERMTRFAELLNGNVSYSKIFEKGELCEGKTWTAQIVCFSVGELEEELSTEVTEEEIENGIKDEFGVVYSRNDKRLLKCENQDITEYEIKEGTKVICDWAFWGCKSLKQITIPDSVTCICNSVFSQCESLQQIAIPDSVTNIGESAFRECKSLQQIIIPDSVKSIGGEAFGWCESLQQITIPDSVTIIGECAFNGCVNLNIKSNSKRFTITDKLLIDNIERRLISYFGTNECLLIPDSVTSIGDWAFYCCESLQQITIPDSVTNIGKSAFGLCDSLQYNDYNNAHYLGNSDNPYLYLAKAISTDIENCTININCKIIGDGAFSSCNKLSTIIIPDSVISIGYSVFSHCENLTIYYSGRKSFNANWHCGRPIRNTYDSNLMVDTEKLFDTIKYYTEITGKKYTEITGNGRKNDSCFSRLFRRNK